MKINYSHKNYFISSSQYQKEAININSHSLFFSPSSKIIKYTPANNSFFLLIEFHSFNGVMIENEYIHHEVENGLIHFSFKLDYSRMDFSSPCITEIIIDLKDIDILQSFLEKHIRVNYAIHITNPLTKEGVDNKNVSLISYLKNSSGGSTDPIDDFPK